MNETAKLLPIANMHGKEFLVDIVNRQFRNFSNADEIIEMHSIEGRQMVEEMLGTEWNCMGISTGKQKGLEV